MNHKRIALVRVPPATPTRPDERWRMDFVRDTTTDGRPFRRPGRPVENCFIESFTGRLRDECLNVHPFDSLTETRRVIDAWREEYNTARPHSGIGNRAPAERAAQFTLEKGHSSSTDADRAVA